MEFELRKSRERSLRQHAIGFAYQDLPTPRRDGRRGAGGAEVEGRWLDVPRLQQRSKDARSNFWSGRASATMIYNYYRKANGKTGEHIGHDKGDVVPGLNGCLGQKVLRCLRTISCRSDFSGSRRR